jgi:hypothetical protein
MHALLRALRWIAHLVIMGLAGLVVGPGLSAQNIVTNPSFETPTAWNLLEFGYYTSPSQQGSGSVGVRCSTHDCVSTFNSGAFFEQQLHTSATQTYQLSFYVLEDAGATSEFSVFWGNTGTFVGSVLNPANNSWIGQQQNWVQYTFSDLVAVSDSTNLQIHGRSASDRSYIWFDNISVIATGPPVPEPATWAMMLLGFGGIGFAMRRQRRWRTNVQA